jgi:hypothetical protein
MTVTQTMSDRTHDRQTTQLRSALQFAREQAAATPPKMGRLTKRTFTYEQHGFFVDVHVELEPDWRGGRRHAAPAVDTAINMAIGAADQLDARGEFRFSPRTQGGVSVYIVAEACGRR